MELWDTVVWYFSQLWLSFYATVIAPRPMGVMTAPIVAVLLTITFLWVVVYLSKLLRRKRWRKVILAVSKARIGQMSPDERAKYLSLLMEQCIERDVEFLHEMGDITRDERAWLYRQFAVKMGYHGLLRCIKRYIGEKIHEARAKGGNATYASFLKAQEAQQTKGVKKAETFLEILGDEPKEATLEDILDGKK